MRRLVGLALLIVAGCAPDITDTDFFREHPVATGLDEAHVEIGQIKNVDLVIKVSAPDSLHIGASTIGIDAVVNGTSIEDGKFVLTPQWVASGRILTSPLGTVQLTATGTPGRFEGTPFFVEPKGQKGHWQLHITYLAGGQSGESILPVYVRPAPWVQGTHDYYVSWVRPVRPVTEAAAIEFALHRLTSDGFAPMEDVVLDLYPWMDMGAGQGHSTPYVAPSHVQEGHYRGAINFIMSGRWDLTVFVQRPGMTRDTVEFKGFIVY